MEMQIPISSQELAESLTFRILNALKQSMRESSQVPLGTRNTTQAGCCGISRLPVKQSGAVKAPTFKSECFEAVGTQSEGEL